MNDLSSALETEREIVTLAALPDRMFCIVCRAALDPVIVGGQYKVPVETGFFEYSHPPTPKPTVVTEPSARQLVYAFMELPTHRKLERLRDLGLYEEGDCD